MCEQNLTDEERDHRPTGPVAFVDEIIVALTNGRIYSAEHPRMKSSLEFLHTGLQAMLQDAKGGPVRIGAAEGFLFFNQRPLLGVSLSSRRLLDPLRRLESGGLSFAPETTRADLETFIRFLGREVNKVEHQKEANQALEQQGCRTIRFLPPFSTSSGSWTDAVEASHAASGQPMGSAEASGSDSPEATAKGALFGPAVKLDFNIPMRIYQDVVMVMQDAMLDACRGKGIDTASSSTLVESILKQLSQDAGSMLGQARYEKYDAFTFGHSIRVCFIALNFARQLTKDERMLQRIGLAALLHDIGKARIPFDVLHSTGRLSDAERAEMNMHTVHGGQILLESGSPDPLAVAVAFSHHQNADGTGYPHAIRGSTQSPATMIVKIADVYEALTAARPYKAAMSPARAYRIMMDMGANFEPSLLRRFIEVNGLYPIGTHVRLSTGEVARVCGQTSSFQEPVVTTIFDDQGRPIAPPSTERTNLSKVRSKDKLKILGPAVDSPPLQDAA